MENKNVWLFPTEQQTIIHSDHTGLYTSESFQESKIINSSVKGLNAYITKPDEDIQENDYIITKDGRLVKVTYLLSKDLEGASKVVLSTDINVLRENRDICLIKNVFLSWFLKKANDSGKPIDIIEVNKIPLMSNNGRALFGYRYEVVIPDEEPKCTCKTGEPYNNTCCKVHGYSAKEESKQWLENPKWGVRLTEDQKPNLKVDFLKLVYPDSPSFSYRNWKIFETKELAEEWVKNAIILNEESKEDLEKEMFELEQELDIPSSMRWHNSKPKQTIEEVDLEKFSPLKFKGDMAYNKTDMIEFAKIQSNQAQTEIEELKRDKEELVEALKYSFLKIVKPIARTKVNADYYDKYFEIEQLITKQK